MGHPNEGLAELFNQIGPLECQNGKGCIRDGSAGGVVIPAAVPLLSAVAAVAAVTLEAAPNWG